MTYTFDENIISDLYKDARGFRPSEYFWEEWTQVGDEGRQQIWDSLCDELTETMDREKRYQAQAMFDLFERLDNMYELGAQSEVQALKWIIEAEKFSSFDLLYGADHFCYHFGIAYDAKNKLSIQEAINEMLVEDVE